ncbi:hypothetical protein GCM10022222_69760 [Amycolatopsis ultiminotia]|uniref:Uncharacterized protein n=1 Tax=Amycolatopsis ultiminotia TaxID=543629 RepID=A0ABP6Y192_9PSEU
MSLENTLSVAVFCGLFGLAILIVLWPGERQGARLLEKWGVRDPNPDQVAVAVRYLRRRRFWYPWLFVGLPLIPQLSGGFDSLVVVVLLGGLIAEAVAQRPSPQVRREAVLAPRRVLDFAPLWAIIVAGVAEIAAATRLIIVQQWPLLGVTVAAAVAAWIIVLLAVRRPATGDAQVDLALRTRSARVALGLGTATAAMVGWHTGHEMSFPTFIASVVSIAAFLAIVGPPPKKTKKQRTTTATAR